ncbi:olfactory receptor 5V1-like [Hyla sarda]|uniref:olfactory receptor 5V1-like n=1 Tax=Hyla sarda TaxID=327740 RepID=UPI0024C304B8|nr:olfactory receptor 5V1-like [Hyla sarda]
MYCEQTEVNLNGLLRILPSQCWAQMKLTKVWILTYIPDPAKQRLIVYQPLEHMPLVGPQHQKNHTSLEYFLLLNLSDGWVFVTILFFVIYCTILIGNLIIFSIIRVEPHLHTPMYFFLSNLSVLDFLYSSVTLPLMLFNCITGNTKISFRQCIGQLYLFVSLGGAECILLAVMAYDRFVAICNPLLYPVVMSVRTCASLAAASWLSGFLNSILHTVMTANLIFCNSEQSINHFYCDVPPLIQVACNPTKTSKILLFVVSVFLGFTPFLYIVISYVHIISTITKMKSSEGRWKAFSTCSSHLIVVTMFYGTANLNYVGPSGYSLELEQSASLLYSILTPLVNPVIYCLRNKEVKAALKKHFRYTDFKGTETSRIIYL